MSQPTANSFPPQIEVYDAHTEGEPTRIVVAGWPQPDGSSMEQRRRWMQLHQDHLRQAVVCEPRGHDAIVGALLTPPTSDDAHAGIVFFNNAGYLGMCGHGLIGVVRGLEFLGKIGPGEHLFDTPVGSVRANLSTDGQVTFRNVPCSCLKQRVEIDVPGVGPVIGDVAWGGNGFFITDSGDIPLTCDHLDALLARSRAIAEVVDRPEFLPSIGISDFNLGAIDHVEFSAPGLASASERRTACDGRNFVLCPGGEWDRSPCGTGTSAKLAVLNDRGDLELGQHFRNQSITGGLFTGWLEVDDDGTLWPYIRGSAWVVSHATLQFADRDPLVTGFTLRECS